MERSRAFRKMGRGMDEGRQRLRDIALTSPFLRPLRRTVRYLTRAIALMLNAVGLRLDPDRFIPHPVDRKVSRHLADSDDAQRLLAVYDLAVLPLSFDIVYFLANAANQRRLTGRRWFDVAFVAHHSDPLQDNWEPANPVKSESHQTFVHGIGIAATRLFDDIGNVLLFTDRRQFADHWRRVRGRTIVFPTGYSPYHPDTSVPADQPPPYGMLRLARDGMPPETAYGLRPPAEHTAVARSWLSHHAGGKKAVTVTLRETPYQPRRNSNIPEWQKLVDHYRDQDIVFVVLRDFFALGAEPALSGPNVREYPEAVLNLPLRAALYQEAYLNLFVNNGPAGLCYLNHLSRYLVFKMVTGDPSAREEDILRQHGVTEGQSPWGATAFQRWVWEADDFGILRRETDAMLTMIAAG